MKVIFLDFDGVLNSENWYKRRFKEIDREDLVGNYPFYEFDPLSTEGIKQSGIKEKIISFLK